MEQSNNFELLAEIDEYYEVYGDDKTKDGEGAANQKKRTCSQRSSNSDADSEIKQPKKQLKSCEVPVFKMPNDDAPQIEWNKFMCKQMLSMNSTIQELMKSAEFACAQSKQVLDLSNSLNKKLNSTQLALNNERRENERLSREMSEMKEKLIRTECYQRRQNIIFDGFAEVRGETDHACYNKVVGALADIEDIGSYAPMIKISRCHRLGPYMKGRTRGIICHIHWFGDKNLILDHRMELPENVTVREDFPPEVEQRRKQLYPILRAARSTEKYRGRCRLAVDKLIIAGRAYTAGPQNNLHDLPSDLHPTKVSQKCDDNITVFYGQNHPFSNFHETRIRVDNIVYNCAEQYVQSKKCALFDDDIGQSRVMKTNNAYDMRKIGSRVKNYDAQTWLSEMPNIAFTVTLAKFEQNEKLKKMLLDTNDTLLGEGSRDKMWGVGLAMHDKNVLKESTWKGDNLMGKTLMKVRYQLRD